MQERRNISVFKNFNEVVANLTVKEIATIIASDKYKSQVKKLRILKKSGNDKQYSGQKKILPAFSPSGMFQGGRRMEFLKQYSAMIILDIDKISNEKLEIAKQVACRFAFTHCCFYSPGGDGLKIIVKVIDVKDNHKRNYNAIKQLYERLLGVKIDPSGKDITRLCFFSHDADAYYNDMSKEFQIQDKMNVENDVKKIIEQIDSFRIDITNNYKDWCKIGFALESEFGEYGRSYFHSISRHFADYNHEICNEQYDKCLKSTNSGITIKTLFHLAKDYGIDIRSDVKRINGGVSAGNNERWDNKSERNEKVTTNKFTLTEKYLNQRFDLRYNVVSNKFEYKKKEREEYEEMNENNMFIQLQKDNINISLNHLVALLKSDFVRRYHVFRDYFDNLPGWDGETDYIKILTSFLKTKDRERLERHFKKWLVRAVRTAIDDNYFNKQAFILVSMKQNSGKSTFCRFLCPDKLKDYIVESIATDKDSRVAITENFLINLDELSQAEKAEINAFKSMFSKDKIKDRLTYDKRPTVHARRCSFIGSTDRWEFLTDENGSVRWLCFEIDSIDWNYSKEIGIDRVWSQAHHLLMKTNFQYELTADEIRENDWINKKYQVSSPERDLVMKYFEPSTEEIGQFKTATEMLEYIAGRTSINLSTSRLGKELRFLGFERKSKRIDVHLPVYGYFVKMIE